MLVTCTRESVHSFSTKIDPVMPKLSIMTPTHKENTADRTQQLKGNAFIFCPQMAEHVVGPKPGVQILHICCQVLEPLLLPLTGVLLLISSRKGWTPPWRGQSTPLQRGQNLFYTFQVGSWDVMSAGSWHLCISFGRIWPHRATVDASFSWTEVIRWVARRISSH